MKYEQIVLVVLGYVIGFVTAFIGLELTDTNRTYTKEEAHGAENYGLVAKASNGASDNQQAAIVDAVLNNDGLFAKVDGEERIVSAGAIPPKESIAGFHYAVIEVLISPDQHHLYYCVQIDPADSYCESFIYRSTNDTVYPVKDTQTGEYLKSEIAELEVTWSEDGSLTINNRSSASPDTPWMIE